MSSEEAAMLAVMQKTFSDNLTGETSTRFDRNGNPILKHQRHLPPELAKNKSIKSDGSPSKKEKDKSKFKVTFIDKIDKE